MKTLFVTPYLGSWATHGHHVAPNQMFAHWGRLWPRTGTVQPEVLDCKALEISWDMMLKQIKEKKSRSRCVGGYSSFLGGFAVQNILMMSLVMLKSCYLNASKD